METRRYDQPCPLATALDILGSRWTLLIVRELLLGPKRFSELQRRLDGIGPNRLSARLKELQQQHVVDRDDNLYVLSPYGEGLRKPLVGISVWGLSLMADSLDLTAVRPEMIALCVAESARRDAVGDLSMACEVRVGADVFTIATVAGRLGARSGSGGAADAVLECSPQTFADLVLGALSPTAASKQRRVELSGAADDVDRLFEVLSSTAKDLLAQMA